MSVVNPCYHINDEVYESDHVCCVVAELSQTRTRIQGLEFVIQNPESGIHIFLVLPGGFPMLPKAIEGRPQGVQVHPS